MFHRLNIHTLLPHERDAHSMFIASVCASVTVHALIFNALGPLGDVLPPSPVHAFEVTLAPPQPLPVMPAPQAVALPPQPKHTDGKARATPVVPRKPLVREIEPALPASAAAVETAVPEKAPPAAVLTREEDKGATVLANAATGGSGDAPAGIRTEQKETLASIRPAESVVPPTFNAGYLRNPPPRYPLVARLNGEQGTVTLNVVVTQQGLPRRVTVEKTSGFPLLDAAAVQTVQKWRFVPARRGEQPIEDAVAVPIRFRLEDAW